MTLITTGQAARRCGVGINTIKRWIQKGELPCVITPGGHWRIDEQAFQKFLATLKNSAAAPPGKVLLVEDDPLMCTLIEDAFALEQHHINFDYARDGYSGLMKIGAMKPDLIILDIMLPKINGLELIQRIRSSEISRHARIIVITGTADRRVVRRALNKAELDAVFLKPFNVDEMVQCALDLLQPSAAPHSARSES